MIGERSFAIVPAAYGARGVSYCVGHHSGKVHRSVLASDVSALLLVDDEEDFAERIVRFVVPERAPTSRKRRRRCQVVLRPKRCGAMIGERTM
jgi:hypothetical protein